ncbi:DUF2058 family protein [Hahella sp. KA22]|uniref:DUF2058 domain-containing protein n=1 Tax=Hahella sp. KA22 TaxID=1628392 RepID=UPI000FDE97FA|nr:DUF2058 domain-containing protein [Hahella sp. KA22]AZZ93868.1 DUF2058 domain-containing protein [Hahella sp. KA22]QAY57241.1 DUF2058 family protein [Hahella sp. KA22]
MAKSLQEQLLKAGLVDQKKAKQIKQEKRKQAKQTPKGQQVEDETKLRAQQAREEKAQRDREMNRLRQEEADRKALKAQVKQLIEMNRINRKKGEVGYQFADEGKVKKIYVTQELQDGLASGRFAVARMGDAYEVISRKVAEKIRERAPEFVVVLNENKNAEPDEDDPYAAYQIPDDLMW